MNEKEFTTMDLYLGAYLMMSGIQVGFRQNGQRMILTFPVTDKLYSLMSDFNGNISVPVDDYVTTMKRLKSLMFAQRGKG